MRLSGDDLQFGPEVAVVLPTRIARRGARIGWATSATDVDRLRSVATIALPTTVPELFALQGLLSVAYSAAFAPPTDRG